MRNENAQIVIIRFIHRLFNRWIWSGQDYRFSAVLDNQIIHDIATQLLSSGYISSPRFWSMLKPMCEEIEDENGVLIIDDFEELKTYTDCNDLICWHFDNTENEV